jgi:hypothetical protein
MKQIPLRVIEASEGAAGIDYSDAIRTVIRQPLDPQRGVHIDELRRGIRILDKLDASTDTLELEDADYDHLRQKIEAMAWGMVDRNLLDFIDAIFSAAERSNVNGLVEMHTRV